MTVTAAFAVLLLVFVGCAGIEIPREDTERLRAYLQDRTYFLFEGRDLEAVMYNPLGQSLSFLGDIGEEVGISTLTPISEDGYFLTNVHSLEGLADDTSMWIVAFNNGAPFFVPAQVVWKAPKKADVAVIWAPVETAEYFEWSNLPQPAPHGAVLMQGGFRSRLKLGRVLWESPGGEDVEPHAVIEHTVKSRKGDSGGPLITLDGRFLALNSQWRVYGGKGIRPDEELITRIIAGHRARRRGAD